MRDAFEQFKEAATTSLAGNAIRWSMIQAALGLTSEAGEFAQAIRKLHFEDGGLCLDKMRRDAAEELSDLMAYAAYAARQLDLTMDDLLGAYLTKRAQRRVSGDAGVGTMEQHISHPESPGTGNAG